MEKLFNVLSPDSISIDFEGYKTEKKAEEAFKRWAKQYERQGYYSSNMKRIPLNELRGYCQLVTIVNNVIVDQKYM